MAAAMNTSKQPKIPNPPKLFPDVPIAQLLDQVQNKNAQSILGEFGLAGLLKKEQAERKLAAKLPHHLAIEAEQGRAGNLRNGSRSKKVITPNGELNLDFPRDWQATFEQQLAANYQRQLPDLDDLAISINARSMRVREIAGHFQELYALEVSPDLIFPPSPTKCWPKSRNGSNVRSMRCSHFNALPLKIHDEGTVKNNEVYLALGIRADGRKGWGCGLRRPKAPSSDSRCSTN